MASGLDEGQPTLPYPDDETGRTSGWAGSDSSADRAHYEDTSGVTAARQRDAVRALDQAGSVGLTWRELADRLGLHHGQASSVLSNLHHGRRIARLSQRRNRSKIYVLPEFIDGRDTERPGVVARNRTLKEAVEILAALGPCTFHQYPEPDCVTCRAREFVNDYRGGT